MPVDWCPGGPWWWQPSLTIISGLVWLAIVAIMVISGALLEYAVEHNAPATSPIR